MAAMVAFLEAISNINSDYSPSDSDSDSAISDALLEANSNIKSESDSDSTSSDDSMDSLYLRSRESSPVSTPKRKRSPAPVFYPTPVSPYQSEANPTRPEDIVPFVFRKKAITHRPVKTRLFRIAIGENVWA